MSSRKRRGAAVRCSAVREDGDPCRAYALVSTYDSEEGPRCRTHAMTAEQRSRMASRMGNKRALQRRSETEAKPRSDLQPHITLEEVLQVVAPALTAEDHWTGEALWGVRLAAAGTLLAAFPRYYRETPEKVNQLLRQLLPEHVYDSERMKAEKVFASLRASWLQLEGLRWSNIQGLYTKPFPSWCLEPWLSDREVRELQRSRPAPVAPDRAPVRHLPGGIVALERPHAPMFMLPLEEPDESDIVVDADAVPAW